MYDQQVVLKLLRLLEIFTSVAIKSQQINKFVLRVTRPMLIKALVQLFLKCRFSQHGMIILKILENLIKIGIGTEALDEAFAEARNTLWSRKIFNVKTHVDFEDHHFLQFIFNTLLSIRSSQWDKQKMQSQGSYSTSSGLVKILKLILRSETTPAWKTALTSLLDKFLCNTEDYAVGEFDILMSLFEGGEYHGMTSGTYGKTNKNEKFTIVGFTQEWFDLDKHSKEELSDVVLPELNSEYCKISDKLLAIYYDDKHPERNYMFLVAPDDIKLISNLTDEFSDYLLNKERLDKFLNTFDLTTLPAEKEVTSLMKRCLGMKILITHIQKYGEKFLKLFDPKYTEQLLNELLSKCIDKKETKDELKLDWYEQKLFVIKRLATESRNSLEPSMNILLEEMKTEQDVDFINDISKM